MVEVCESPVKTNSTHRVEVVPVRLEKHPNADSLSVVTVFGYTVCVGTESWQSVPANCDGTRLGAYVPPDSLVDVGRPEFDFLADQAKADGKVRIKAKKLRGIVSFGLLVPAPDGSVIGDDVAEQLGVTHYEPPMEGPRGGGGALFGGESCAGPTLVTNKYDLDAFRRYHHLFTPGEPVFVTEKIDGCNARYVYVDGEMFCGSRTEWKREYPSYDHVTAESLAPKVGLERDQEILEKLRSKPKVKNLWWQALERTPALEQFCRDHPGIIVYGEVFGHVQKLRYGHKPGHCSFAAFDLMQGGQWIDARLARMIGRNLPWVPSLGEGIPFDFDSIVALSEGQTLWPGADHIREGCVVKPMDERWDDHIGRVCFKCVGGTYLEKYR